MPSLRATILGAPTVWRKFSAHSPLRIPDLPQRTQAPRPACRAGVLRRTLFGLMIEPARRQGWRQKNAVKGRETPRMEARGWP